MFSVKRGISTDQTIAKYSLCVRPYRFPASLRERDNFPIGREVSAWCFRRKTYPTWLLHAPVFNVTCPVELGMANTGGIPSASFNAFIAASCFSLSGPNLPVHHFVISRSISHYPCEVRYETSKYYA